MDTNQTLSWNYFKEVLLQHPELHLQFHYEKDRRVKASYHITEIKQAAITSVDCGGLKNEWVEIIMQLWEPNGEEQERPMKVNKALSIINTVEKVLQLDTSGLVKIEFGNTQFDTRQMIPAKLTVEGEDLVVDLQPDQTQCKAINRGGSCGTDAKGEECCQPEEKPKVFKNLASSSAACCEPSSGCC